MKLYEKLADVLLDLAECHNQGVFLKDCIGVLEEVQKTLPYNAQLDISESCINTLVFNASMRQGGSLVPFLVTVQPTFLGLDVSVDGLSEEEIAFRVMDDFSTVLMEED